MFPPPLPSRVRKEAARELPTVNISSSASNPTPFRNQSQGKDIPNLFSKASTRVVVKSNSPQSLTTGADPIDVIEISSGASDAPPSPLKGKAKTSKHLSLIKRPKKGIERFSRQEKTISTIHSDVIEILDSEEEQEIQGASNSSIRKRGSQVPLSPNCSPPLGMTAMEKSDASTPPFAKVRKTAIQVPNYPRSPPSLKHLSKVMKPTSNPSSPGTESTPARTQLSGGHSRKRSSVSNTSEGASKTGNTSSDGNIDMRDLHIALDTPPPSKKGKGKEEIVSKQVIYSYMLMPTIHSFCSAIHQQKRLVLTARKSSQGFPPRRQLPLTPTFISFGGLGCSPDSVIDLTGEASDEDGVTGMRKSIPSENGNLSTPPTASDTGILDSL